MAEEKKDPFKGKSISATKGGKIKVTPTLKETKMALEGFIAEQPRYKAPKPMNFTQMPATCVCGKSLTLTLQEPHYQHIAWSCFCTSCRWRVTVSLTR